MSANSDSSVVSYLIPSQKQVHGTASKTLPSLAPALPSGSDSICYSPCAHSALAGRPLWVPQYPRLAPASTCLTCPPDCLTCPSFLLKCPLLREVFLVMLYMALANHVLLTRLQFYVLAFVTRSIFVSCLLFTRRENLCCSHCIANVLGQCPAQRKRKHFFFLISH